MSFADDTVLYIEGKTKEIVYSQMNLDLRHVTSYFQSNQLVINLKQGKTEAMLFGTSKRLSTCSSKAIETTETYKYLGTALGTALLLTTNFNKMCNVETMCFVIFTKLLGY